MNKIKLSKLTSGEKIFMLIYYADKISRISFIYKEHSLFKPFNNGMALKDYKRLKSLLTRANRLRGCISDDDLRHNRSGFTKSYLDRIDAVCNKGYFYLFVIALFTKSITKSNYKRSMQLCLQRGVMVNQITRTRVLKEVDINN